MLHKVEICWDALTSRLRFVMQLRTMLAPTRALWRVPNLDQDCWELVESAFKRTMQTKGGYCMYIALKDGNSVFVRFAESLLFRGFSKNDSCTAALEFQFPNCQLCFDSIADPDFKEMQSQAQVSKSKERQAQALDKRNRMELWSESIFTSGAPVAVTSNMTAESIFAKEKSGKRAHEFVVQDERAAGSNVEKKAEKR